MTEPAAKNKFLSELEEIDAARLEQVRDINIILG